MDYYPAIDIVEEAKRRRDFSNLNEFGERIHFMVYSTNEGVKNSPLIIPVIFSEAGTELAKIVRNLIPQCRPPKIGRHIMIYDIEDCETVFNETETSFICDGFIVGVNEIDYATIAVSIAEFN